MFVCIGFSMSSMTAAAPDAVCHVKAFKGAS